MLLKSLLLLSGWGVAIWLGYCAPREGLPVVRLSEPGGLEDVFGAIAADPSMAGASLAFCVLDEDGTLVLASPLATTALPPASALKTLTTAVALEVLTPQFQFETVLRGSPLGSDGVLRGELTLVGAGDPTLQAGDIDAMVAAAKAAGLKRIVGSVRVDSSVFPSNPASDHWNWGDVGNAYGAGAYGLNVDHNRLQVRFLPGSNLAEPAALQSQGEDPAGIRWINEVVTGPRGSGDQVVAYSEPYGETITLRGTVPMGEPGFEVQVANPNPPHTALSLLSLALKKQDIEVTSADAGQGPGGPEQVVLARHLSPPLSEIIPHLHRVSDNLEAQCLFLLLGNRAGKPATEALREHWLRRGVDFAGLRLLDGSGLARANMIRPVDLALANQLAAAGPYGALFQESLSSYDASVRAKRGAMSGVRTEVGFLTLPSGRVATFALMANGLLPGADLARHRAALFAHAAAALDPAHD